MIQLQGKDYVLFRELLEIAHEKGLESVTNEIVQIPDALNDYFAVVKATVVITGKTYSAYGDASPKSVNKMIVPHILRMAETRAIGRAFRVGLNIGVVMKEELGGDDSGESAPKQPTPATDKQMRFIKVLLDTKKFEGVGIKLWESATNFLSNTEIQTADNASKLVEKLKTLPDQPLFKDVKMDVLVDIERLEHEHYSAVPHRENSRKKYVEGYPDKGQDLSRYGMEVLKKYAQELNKKEEKITP